MVSKTRKHLEIIYQGRVCGEEQVQSLVMASRVSNKLFQIVSSAHIQQLLALIYVLAARSDGFVLP